MTQFDFLRFDLAALDRLIEKITVDTYSHDEQPWAFRHEDEVSFPCQGSVIATRKSLNKEMRADLYQGATVELAVLSATGRTARCRILANDRVVTFRTKGLWDATPGEIMVVRPRKCWCYAGQVCAS
jgi:hypothetical protein